MIGYENRILPKEDFNDDGKDAGELGAGHSVTALYEIVRTGSKTKLSDVDELKYQKTEPIKTGKFKDELMTVKLRYKPLYEDKSLLIPVEISAAKEIRTPSDNYKFSAAVVEFGMLLRDSEFKGNSSFENIIELAKSSLGEDESGYRAEFVRLVQTCQLMKN